MLFIFQPGNKVVTGFLKERYCANFEGFCGNRLQEDVLLSYLISFVFKFLSFKKLKASQFPTSF